MTEISRSYQVQLIEALKDPIEAAAYLNAALEDGSVELFLLALQNVAEALTTSDASQIAMYLRNYAVLIGDAAELAGEWTEMDEQEQIHHRSLAMQIWGMRVTLGELYRAGRLASDQVAKLTDLDHALLDQATNIEIAYGPSIWQLVKNLLDWGTPLSEEKGSVRLTVPVQTLPALAKMFAK